VIAGPYSVESAEMIVSMSANRVKSHKGSHARGGAFKPRTSPYSFNGLGAALEFLEARGPRHSAVGRVMDTRQSRARRAHRRRMLQIGARNLSENFLCSRELAGAAGRFFFSSVGCRPRPADLLMAARHVMAAGNSNIVFCASEGIPDVRDVDSVDSGCLRHFCTEEETHLPVIVPIRATPAGGARLVLHWRSRQHRCRARTGSWSRCTPVRGGAF